LRTGSCGKADGFKQAKHKRSRLGRTIQYRGEVYLSVVSQQPPQAHTHQEQWVKEYINSQVKKGSIKEFVESEIKRRQEKKKTIDKTTLIEAYHGRGSKNV